MKKGMNKFLLVIVIILAAAVFAKDFLIKTVLEAAVNKVTGLPLKIDSLKVGITTSLIDIKGLKLYNPKEYVDPVMINIPEIYVDYELASLLTGKIHVTQIRLHLEEFLVVKNKDGEVNINKLKAIQQQQAKPSGEKVPSEARKQQLQIDSLSIKADRAVYKDYSKDGEPTVKVFNLGIDQTYKDIHNIYSVVSIIVVRTLAQTSIANLTNIDISGLSDVVSGTLKGATESTKKVIGETTDVLKDTTETLKKTTELITDIFKKK